MKKDEQKKPNLKLTGEDGNAVCIIARAMRALRRAGYSTEQIEKYQKEAMSGDYENVIYVTSQWCDVT